MRTLYILLLGLIFSGGSALAFKAGDIAPDFTLKNLEGETIVLSELIGRPVVLEIGTTWCPGCRIQSKDVDKAVDSFSDSVATYKIFIQETEKSVREYIEDVDSHPGRALLDDKTVLKRYSIFLIPRVLVIDATGRIAYDGGQTDAEVIIQQLMALLPTTE